MVWQLFLQSPRQTAFRRIVFQVHLWLGLSLGLYLLVMSLTGAVLLFEDELSAWRNPSWYYSLEAGRPPPNVDTVMQSVRMRYPDHRIFRIYAPSTKRYTFLVIVEAKGVFRTVFADPATGRILGVIPTESFMLFVWEMHSNLLAGTFGRVINCTLGLVVPLLVVTGLIVWWPGARQWWRALGISTGKPLLVFARGLHGAVGLWSCAFILMFAVTGALYFYGPQFYRVLGIASPLTNEPTPFAGPPNAAAKSLTIFQPLVDQAELASPGKRLWGLFPAWSDKSPIRVVVGPPDRDLGASDWEWRNQGNRYFYFDQYTGALLRTWDLENPTFADQVRRWMVPMHRGSIGGLGLKTVWLIAGLAPALLFLLGALMWWTRSVRSGVRKRTTIAMD